MDVADGAELVGGVPHGDVEVVGGVQGLRPIQEPDASYGAPMSSVTQLSTSAPLTQPTSQLPLRLSGRHSRLATVVVADLIPEDNVVGQE